MSDKSFKTIDEQIEILKAKGLSFFDEHKAHDILLRENYFFISGYRHLLMKSEVDNRFVEGATFDELYAIFLFDRQIRNILFKNILIVENNLKSVLSYVVSKNHGFKEKNYLDPKIFDRDPNKKRQINDLIRKMKRQISVNGKQHSATSHFIDRYGFIPLWVVVKVLSFGIVGEVYTILKRNDQEEIANIFKIDVETFKDYLPILANYRNLCAHEDICYVNRTVSIIDDTLYHNLLNIPKINGEYIYGKNDLFSLIIILKRVLDDNDFHLLLQELKYEYELLAGKIKCIDPDKILDRMGFPLNYYDLGDMNEK